VADRAHDVTPAAPRLAPVRGPAVMVTWRAGEAVEHVPAKEFASRVREFIGREPASVVLDWAKRNSFGLREFWQHDKDAALGLKAEIEKAAARQEPKEAQHEEPAAPADDGQAAMALTEAATELSDMETVLRDLIAEVSKEPDAKKRRAIW